MKHLRSRTGLERALIPRCLVCAIPEETKKRKKRTHHLLVSHFLISNSVYTCEMKTKKNIKFTEE